MKRTKTFLLMIAIACASTATNAQTNLFPTTGNVGIGTITPGKLLDVVGATSPSIRVKNTGSSLAASPSIAIDRKTINQRSAFVFRTNNVDDWNMGCQATGSAFSISGISGTALYINPANNNVGIGTTTPLAQLSVKGQGTSSIHIGQVFTGGVYTYVGINMNGIIDNNHYNILSGTDDQDLYFNRPYGHRILFVKNGTDYQMGLDSSGNLGIGTIAPTSKLQVINTNGYAGSFDAASTTQAIGVQASAHGTSTNVGLATNATSVSGNIGYGLYSSAAGPGTNWSGYFSSGNVFAQDYVCIGTTTPLGKLTVQTGAGAYGLMHTNGTISMGTYLSAGAGGEFGTYSNHNLNFFTNNSGPLMTINTAGNVGIGTITPGYKLDVCGTIRSKEVRVETGWCDYVFAAGYKLTPLSEVESYIKANKHLPDVTPGAVIESDGLEVGKTSAQMIKKIEELTLYVIELQKQVDELKKNNK